MKSFVIHFTGFATDHTGEGITREVRNSPRINFEANVEPEDFLNMLFHETNIYTGEIYDKIIATGFEPRALSVGDMVTVDITRYVVCGMGFAQVDLW